MLKLAHLRARAFAHLEKNMKKSVSTLFVLASLASFGQAQIVSTTGATSVIAPPSSVNPNATESDTQTFVFFESNALLTSDLAVDGIAAGVYTSSVAGTVASGTDVSSYFLHGDKIGSTATGVSMSGSITFAQNILGVIATSPKLNASNFLGAPGTSYGTNSLRDYELGANEFFTISNDLKTLTYQYTVSDSADQLRIVTDAVPEPASMTILGAAVAGFIARRKKRNA
jgi:hypothetical protein